MESWKKIINMKKTKAKIITGDSHLESIIGNLLRKKEYSALANL